MIKQLYNRLISYLIGQAECPHGLLGRFITLIWTVYFKKLSLWTLSYTVIEDHSKILEIGYGGGATIKRLVAYQRKLKIYGIDPSHNAYQRTLKNNKQAIKSNEVKLSIGKVEELTYETMTFDTVFAIQTHIFWSDLSQGISEIYRVIRDGGQLIISCEISKIAYHQSQYGDSSIFIELLETIGFKKVTVLKTPIWVYYRALK